MTSKKETIRRILEGESWSPGQVDQYSPDWRPPRALPDYVKSFGTLSPHKPTLRDRFAGAITGGMNAFGASNSTQRMWNEKIRNAADYLPLLGDAVTAEDAYRDYRAGNYGRAAFNAGLATIGVLPGAGDLAAGVIKATVGGIGKRVSTDLAMDEASRMARAKEMGFHTDEPLYHGSSASFDAFSAAKRGSSTGAPAAQVGTWLTSDPETAAEFADLAVKRVGGSPQIYPLMYRAERPGIITLKGTEGHRQVAATVDDAFDRGYDAVKLNNYRVSEGKTGITAVVVRDPALLRSRFAAFDPAKKMSPELTAGLSLAVPMGLFGMTAFQKPRDKDEQ